MVYKCGLIVGCLMGCNLQRELDWNRWELPILLRYCPAIEPRADRFDRTEETARLETAGFVPLGLVATNLGGQGVLALVIGDETPATVRQYLLQQEPQILLEAFERESLRGAA